jgi:hypothetical protein
MSYQLRRIWSLVCRLMDTWIIPFSSSILNPGSMEKKVDNQDISSSQSSSDWASPSGLCTHHSYLRFQLSPQHHHSHCKSCLSTSTICPLPLNLFLSSRNTQWTIPHQPSFLILRASAISGYEMCKLLIHAIKKQPRMIFDPGSPLGRKMKLLRWRAHVLRNMLCRLGLKRWGLLGGRLCRRDVVRSRADGFEMLANNRWLIVDSSNSSQWAESQMIKNWLDLCHSKHMDCAKDYNAKEEERHPWTMGGVGWSFQVRVIPCELFYDERRVFA